MSKFENRQQHLLFENHHYFRITQKIFILFLLEELAAERSDHVALSIPYATPLPWRSAPAISECAPKTHQPP